MSDSGGKMSLMEIQAEQEREQRNNRGSNHGRRSSGSGRDGGPPPRGSYSGGGRDTSGGSYHRASSGGGGGGGSYHRSSSGGGGRRGSNHSRRGSDRSSLPLERGCICSLKEKFGFIHCADRPTEIFFHYSEVSNIHPDHLQLDDEVEFRVGKSRDNPDKLSALEVTQIPAGTVVWEYEETPGERFQGFIDRPLMRPGGGGNNGGGLMRRNSDKDNDNNMEGLIRMVVVPATADGDEKDTKKAASKDDPKTKSDDAEDKTESSDGPKIRFTANDYNPDPNSGSEGAATEGRRFSNSSNASSSGRLYRGDLVEFTVVIEKRTRQKFARNIVLVQSERERARLVKEKQMLANATLERGVVVSLKQDFGFLRSNARRDEVYFHYSQVQLPPEDEKAEDDEEEHELQIGQEMEFLVVTEELDDRSDRNYNSGGRGGGGGGPKQKTSARKVKFLPKGSVQFDKLIAEGVTGIVSIVPRADAGNGRNNNSKERDPQSLGSIRLPKAVSTTDPTAAAEDSEKQEVEIKKVLLNVANAPGGIFTCSRGSAMGLWIREGDTLLFDIIYDFVDKSYYASPTKHLVPVGSDLAQKLDVASTTDVVGKENAAATNGTNEGGADNKAAPTNDKPENNGSNDKHNTGGQKGKGNSKKQLGPAVRLIRLCLAGRAEGIVHTTKEAYGFVHCAERPVDAHFKQFELLPDEVQDDLRRNMGLSMTLNTKAEMMGFHRLSVGTEVQFDLSVHGTVMTQNQHPNRGANRRGGGANANQHERENLKAQRILILPKGTILQDWTVGLGLKGVITKEDPNQPYAGTLDLEEEYQQMSLEQRHPLVWKMVDEFLNDEGAESVIFHDIQSAKEEDVIADFLEFKGKGKVELTHLPSPGDSQGRLCIRKVAAKAPEEAAATTEIEAKEEAKEETTKKEGAAPKGKAGRSMSPKGSRSKSPKGRATKKKKALQQKMQPIKTIRYDKSSLTQEAKTDVPPGAGDIVLCDLYQNRRTGKTHLENLSVAERSKMDPAEAATLDGAGGIGVVKEVVLASKFGFISVSDEAAAKRELLFFHFSSVIEGQRPNQNQGRNKKGAGAAEAVIHKGDEVKFKIGTEKNGKRVAVDVEVTSSGTIPSKADKNACRGYIMVEPTDTKVGSTPKPSRSFTRSRDAPQPHNSGGGGRWNNVKEDDHHKDQLSSKGEGVILLLEDPSDMFAAAVEKFVGGMKEDRKNEDSKDDSAKKQSSAEGLGKCHLHYQNGALALQGSGAPTTLDSSTNPRRGDLVSFVKSKNNQSGAKDIRVVTRAAATLLRGRLENIDHLNNTAKFVATTNDASKEYVVDLREIVSCAPSQLKNGIEVEGVLHDDAIHGLCRATDLRLETKLGTGKKERPRLNLTVKKDRAGKIMAQSMMAKGPDGTMGFLAGWTQRVSKY